MCRHFVLGLSLWAAALLPAQADEPLLAPGLYAVTSRALFSGAGDDGGVVTHECVTAQDVASLLDFARRFPPPDQLEGCELSQVGDRGWRALCAGFGWNVLHEGWAEFTPPRFIAMRTTTIGRVSLDTVLNGEFLRAECGES